MEPRDYTPEQIEAAFAAVTVGIHRMYAEFTAAAAAFAAWYESLPPDVRASIEHERPIHITREEEAAETVERR